MVAYDTQILYKLITKSATESGLSKICEQYQIQVTDLHRSDYDALLTSVVLKNMCSQVNLLVEELLQLYPNAYYDSTKGKITCHNVTSNPSKRLLEFAKHIKPQCENGELLGKNFCFNSNFETENIKKAMFLVKYIRLNGGNYYNKVAKCDYFLDTDKPCERVSQLQELEKKPLVITEQEICKMLAIDYQEYEQCELLSMSKIKSSKVKV